MIEHRADRRGLRAHGRELGRSLGRTLGLGLLAAAIVGTLALGIPWLVELVWR